MMLVYLLLRNTCWLDYAVSRAAPRSLFASNRAAIVAARATGEKIEPARLRGESMALGLAFKRTYIS